MPTVRVFKVPTGPILCGSIIESHLFRASAMSHFCIPLYHVTIFHPFSHFGISHFGLHWYYPPSPPESSQSLLGQPCTLCSDKGSHMFVPQSHFPHFPWCQFISHITIFPRALVEDPHCLTYGRPYSVDINTSIPEERPRGWCILVPSSTLFWCLGSNKGNHHFPLTWSFHARD